MSAAEKANVTMAIASYRQLTLDDGGAFLPADKPDDARILELADLISRGRQIALQAEDAGLSDDAIAEHENEVWNFELTLIQSPARTLQGLLHKLMGCAVVFANCNPEGDFLAALRGDEDRGNENGSGLEIRNMGLAYVMLDLARMLGVDPVPEPLVIREQRRLEQQARIEGTGAEIIELFPERRR